MLKCSLNMFAVKDEKILWKEKYSGNSKVSRGVLLWDWINWILKKKSYLVRYCGFSLIEVLKNSRQKMILKYSLTSILPQKNYVIKIGNNYCSLFKKAKKLIVKNTGESSYFHPLLRYFSAKNSQQWYRSVFRSK